MARVNSKKHILLIDDDKTLVKILCLQLMHNNYYVDQAYSAGSGYKKALARNYDVIVLDVGLPDKNGLQVCFDLRSQGVLSPILILSGDTKQKTVVGCLRSGADDYLSKPFYKDELRARLDALIRRNKRSFPTQRLQYNGLQLDLTNRTLQAEYTSVKLTKIEASVMCCLIRYAPDIVLREQLFEQVWGIDHEHASNRLDVYIKRVRRHLTVLGSPVVIKTVHGKGYRLGPEKN
jgi:DNA-binding response OmpR family regulator